MSTASKEFAVKQYSLAETLTSGQAFRWRYIDGGWEGVVQGRWVRLIETTKGIRAETATTEQSWEWLTHYLQLEVDLEPIIHSFPADPHIEAAVASARGLRLLRQDPWECLASFILSSTKQIVQIQQIVELICERFGEPLPVPAGHPPAFSFPSSARIAMLDEVELRCCKMGFRAPYLKGSAEMIARNDLDLEQIRTVPVEIARAELMRLPGVGRKIADCVLLFAYGFQEAFPVDVWVLKALRQLYFPKKRKTVKQLVKFANSYFGPNGGYAQQYLFHYMRTRVGKSKP